MRPTGFEMGEHITAIVIGGLIVVLITKYILEI